jgi:uncharacterized protein (DUF885 family)
MAPSIDELASDYFEALLEQEPTWAHLIGEYRHAGAYEDASRAAEDRDIAVLRGFVERAQAALSQQGSTEPRPDETRVPEPKLDEQARITANVIVSDATTRADLKETRLRELSVSSIFGDQVSLPVVVGMLPLPTTEVAEGLCTAFEDVGRYYHQLAERHREGVAHGRPPTELAVSGTIAQLDAALAVPPADDPLLQTSAPPEGLDVEAWRARLVRIIEQDIRPGMTAYRDVLRDEVLPVARPDDRCGLRWLDDGEQTYATALRFHTTTSLGAREIHDIGLQKVTDLAEEYRQLGRSALGRTDYAEILGALRSDPALHFDSAEEVVAASKQAMARAEAALPQWFEVLPQASCAVEGVTTGPLAYYFPPAGDGSRGGTFFVNISEPGAWGTFEMEALAFHEGVPGHHLQLAIASELTDVPAFRKHVHANAYAEGWGLYTERLADEMGLYSSDLARMGMLSMDSIRACRLVVDTGLHALGWSRQQAVDYMLANSAMSEDGIRREVDRYVEYPGQATSYMIGRIELLRMRREAAERQREAFDIKAFHSAVLDSGGLPLDVLDGVVRSRLP